MYRWIFAMGFIVFVSGVGVVQEKIIGGPERIEFKPGDKVLFAEDFSDIPIGETVPSLKLISSTYEIAQFKGKKWIRPLERRLWLVKPIDFPDEFSLAFTVYAFEPGRPFVNVRLYSKRGIAEALKGGFPSKESFLELIALDRENRLILRVSERPRKDFAPLPPVSEERLSRKKPLRITLIVRRGQLRLFVDGRFITKVPFRPQEPIRGIGWYWHHTFETNVPYRDAPVLLTAIRIATYSYVEPGFVRGAKAALTLLTPKPLPKPLAERLQEFGAQEGNKGWWLPLPTEPFEAGSWLIRIDPKVAKGWAEKLVTLIKDVRKAFPNARLQVEGFAPEVKEGKERFALAAARAYALAFWLMKIGVPKAWLTVPQ